MYDYSTRKPHIFISILTENVDRVKNLMSTWMDILSTLMRLFVYFERFEYLSLAKMLMQNIMPLCECKKVVHDI